MSFYRLKQFQCEVTGKSGLDYFQALESEQQEARTMHTRFPEALKPAILRAVQWQVMGRLDHLVEAVYERFKDRYFRDEKVYIDIQGDKFLARVLEVYPPRSSSILSLVNPESNDGPVASSSSRPPIVKSSPGLPHRIYGDLKIPAAEVNAADDPAKYYYKVQILEEEKPEGRDKHGASAKEARARYSGSYLEVQCSQMSRDRLAFSKSILRRFIRDCVDRDAAVASPWTVKPPVAERYGVDTIMPEATRQGVENIKKGEIQKRKKVWEEKEGPAAKKPKKIDTCPGRERSLHTPKHSALVAEKKEREAKEKAEKVQQAKEDAERLAAEKKKKKPIRYPTEDLDVTLSEKEKKAGMKIKRPVPSRVALPFNDTPGTFESFLMTWNFFMAYGHPLHLSSFTLDEYEHALRHCLIDPPCQILAEIHSTLIYNLRTVNFQRHSAVLSLLQLKDDEDDDGGEVLGVTIEQLTGAMADVGNNWERAPLRHADGREGWEESLVGCLKDHATLDNFPALRRVLTRLLFAPEPLSEAANSPSTSRASTPTHVRLSQPSAPNERYHALPPEDRMAILHFMCNVAVSSKAIHMYMESCEEQLTALRKEKIEVNRQRKQYIEERDTLLSETKEGEQTSNGDQEDTPMNGLSDLSDVSASEGTSESGSGVVKHSKSKDLRRKAQSLAHAKQREAARARNASLKQAMAEHRRLDEEVNKLERRLEGIEREFRKLLGSIRVKPLGRDRFYNRIWWFDGLGSASLLGSGGIVQYGTGRLFIQGPSMFDQEILDRRVDDEIKGRRLQEEGEEGMLGVGEWAVYTDLEEVDEFAAWLNPKQPRTCTQEYLDQVVAPHFSWNSKTPGGTSEEFAVSHTHTGRAGTDPAPATAQICLPLTNNGFLSNSNFFLSCAAVLAAATSLLNPQHCLPKNGITASKWNSSVGRSELSPDQISYLLVGSASSGYSFKDAITSYRRSQYFLGTTEGISPSDPSQLLDDEEATVSPVNEEDEDDLPTPRPEDFSHDGTFSNFRWDEDTSEATQGPSMRQTVSGGGELSVPSRGTDLRGQHGFERPSSSTRPRNADERTPLLRKAISLTIDTSSHRPSLKAKTAGRPVANVVPIPSRVEPESIPIPRDLGGKSTFGQTLFNSIAILLGIGMLSEPLAFAYAGWVCGTLLIISYGFITCYTAKLLARIVLSDPHVRSYSDIGRKAFGPKSMPFISAMFCFELFSVSVVLVTLYADSLSVVVPAFSANTYKILGLVILIPTVFMPLSLLSYASILGIICTVSLLAVIFIDGFSKRDAPGSLWSPAATDLSVGTLEELGIAFGLFMAGFSGHAVMPSLARDMIDPSQFDTAMNYAFTFATFIYAVIGIAGYLMFGRNVSDEVSKNLLGVPGYSPSLNEVMLWMLVLNPLSKFALSARPLNLTIEAILGIDTTSLSHHGEEYDKRTVATTSHQSNHSLKCILTIIERVLFVCLSVGVSILVPDFSSMMAILGSFSAFIICVIGPISAKVAIEKKCGLWDAFLLVSAFVMAVWGTGAAFLSTTDPL
ncbi:hypothetical protein EW146_g1101 [Bondarzewia mesenterica]|uniref:DDT domain-containing protein n=1 Tax=Bondarzewia mesenterica TaxID=1095465 RepID=A0A4S4M6D7_9AGAM|nr:hypothetical protein EW146_g1101 [Bondarzewia mesenterica]